MGKPKSLDFLQISDTIHGDVSYPLDQTLEVHNLLNGNASNTYHDLHAPLNLILEYNTCGKPNVIDTIFSASPTDCAQLINSTGVSGVFRPHRHNYFEFLFVLKGKILQEIEGKEYLYTAGSCCLINQNITHLEHFLEESTVLFLGLSTDFVRELIAGTVSSFFPERNAARKNQIFSYMQENLDADTQKNYLDIIPVYQNNKSKEHLHSFADSLLRALLLPKPGADYILKGVLYELFDYLDKEKTFHIIPIRVSAKNDELIFARISHLLSNANGRIRRSELEKILCYSGNYLNSIVKKHTGMNLFDYSMTFCLAKAASLLTETDMSVSSIAEYLKFTNQGHFYKLFKQKYGMLPREYRQKAVLPSDSETT